MPTMSGEVVSLNVVYQTNNKLKAIYSNHDSLTPAVKSSM